MPRGTAERDVLNTSGRDFLSTSSEYLYGCGGAAVIGRLVPMTTHRASKPLADQPRPVERAVTAALILAVTAGVAWIGGMIYTVLGWSL